MTYVLKFLEFQKCYVLFAVIREIGTVVKINSAAVKSIPFSFEKRKR
jgi:hypothetical protein